MIDQNQNAKKRGGSTAYTRGIEYESDGWEPPNEPENWYKTKYVRWDA